MRITDAKGVIFHFGINDIYNQRDLDMEELYNSVTLQTQKMKEIFTGKAILLSSVISKIGNDPGNHNEHAKELNN